MISIRINMFDVLTHVKARLISQVDDCVHSLRRGSKKSCELTLSGSLDVLDRMVLGKGTSCHLLPLAA